MLLSFSYKNNPSLFGNKFKAVNYRITEGRPTGGLKKVTQPIPPVPTEDHKYSWKILFKRFWEFPEVNPAALVFRCDFLIICTVWSLHRFLYKFYLHGVNQIKDHYYWGVSGGGICIKPVCKIHKAMSKQIGSLFVCTSSLKRFQSIQCKTHKVGKYPMGRNNEENNLMPFQSDKTKKHSEQWFSGIKIIQLFIICVNLCFTYFKKQ